MNNIITPALIINLWNFRQNPAEWYLTHPRSDGLGRTVAGVKKTCQDSTANPITRLRIGNGATFKFFIIQQLDRTFSIRVFDDVRGNVAHHSYMRDHSGLIPQGVIDDLETILTRWTRGITDCRMCGNEMRIVDSFGGYVDAFHCSQECADANEMFDKGRSV